MSIRGSIRLGVLILAFLCGLVLAAQTNIPSANDRPGADRDSIQIPAGTILPVRLNHGFSSKNARAGQKITGRLMQDVPLPNAQKIPEGARLRGTVVAVSSAGKSGTGRVSFRFDHIEVHRQSVAIVTDLRALASFMEVQYAQIPETTPGFGTPYSWATTDLIGGGVKYGVGGPVTDRGSEVVGTGTFSGVLVHVGAQPESGCSGDAGSNHDLQALWVFSADSCGVYGMSGIRIAHAGRTVPLGEVVISADSGDVNVRSGSGMLLRVAQCLLAIVNCSGPR
jgi:hypothetical protein